jgi:hypothetical protein
MRTSPAIVIGIGLAVAIGVGTGLGVKYGSKLASEPSAPSSPAASESPRPANRTALLPASVVPRWNSLSPAHQTLLEPFKDSWATLPDAEQRAWAELALRFPRLPADQQERAQKRIQEWAALSPAQRQMARSNYRLAKVLPPEARVQQYEAYRELSPEQRGVLRSAGSTSNTAAALSSPTVGLAKIAAQPMPRDLALRRLPPPAPDDSGVGDANVASTTTGGGGGGSTSAPESAGVGSSAGGGSASGSSGGSGGSRDSASASADAVSQAAGTLSGAAGSTGAAGGAANSPTN